MNSETIFVSLPSSMEEAILRNTSTRRTICYLIFVKKLQQGNQGLHKRGNLLCTLRDDKGTC